MLYNFLPGALAFGVNQDDDPGPPPRWLHQRSSKWFCILTASCAVFTDLFLYAIIVPVLPFALTHRIGVAPQDVQRWVSVLLTIYGVSLLVGSPIAGYWADKMSTRSQSFLFGLLLLLGSTLMFCLATSLPVLLVARIFQGLSAAVVWTVVITIVADRVGSRGLGYAMGWITFGRTISIITGPLLGGVLYAQVGYYPVFGLCFAVISVDVILRFILIEAKIAQRWDSSIGPENAMSPTSDLQDSETAPTQTTESPYAVNRTEKSTQALRNECHEYHRGRIYNLAHHLPPTFTLLGSARMIVAIWGLMFQALLVTGFDAVIPLFCHNTFGWSSLGGGLIFLALDIPTFISPLIGWLSDKHGPKWYSTAGYLLGTPPLILLRLVTHESLEQKVLLCALLALLGASMMFWEIPLWVEIVSVVDVKVAQNPEFYGKGAVGQAYGLGNMAFALGAILGPIWAGFVYQSAGWATMGWSMGLLSALSAIPTLIWSGGNIFERKRTPDGTGEREGAVIDEEKGSAAVEKREEPAAAELAQRDIEESK